MEKVCLNFCLLLLGEYEYFVFTGPGYIYLQTLTLSSTDAAEIPSNWRGSGSTLLTRMDDSLPNADSAAVNVCDSWKLQYICIAYICMNLSPSPSPTALSITRDGVRGAVAGSKHLATELL